MMQFEDPRDADDAIYGRDGYDFDGCRLRVSYNIYLYYEGVCYLLCEYLGLF